MLRKFLGKSHRNTASAPQDARIYAIGDIHGCLTELDALLGLIKNDAKSDLNESVEGDGAAKSSNAANSTTNATLVFLGDYIDRGPASKEVIDRLIDLQNSDWQTVFLKGNHEAAMLNFMAAPRKHSEWLHWGGAETLESYGIEHVWSRDEDDLAANLASVMPQSHRDFLETLELMHQEADYIFVHAGLKPGIALEEQEEQDLLWIRSEFHNTAPGDRLEYTVIHGHHPVKKPQDRGWRVNVDTGACWSGMLSAVVLEKNKRRFLST